MTVQHVRKLGWQHRTAQALLVSLLATAAVMSCRASADPVQGARTAIVLFSRFADEPDVAVPFWASDLFHPDLPGSFTHFYDTMSFGRLQVRGEVGARVYVSPRPASTYLSDDPTTYGHFARYAWEILTQADQDIDFSRFDNDGPDGEPSSGDDDGYVDAVFLVLSSTPAGFFLGNATGIGHLGFEDDFVTDDAGASGEPVRIDPSLGTLQRGRTFAKAVGSLAHEFGHLLGLPDLYNTSFLYLRDALPEQDSAGIGRWGLMGWGAHGWRGDDGPNSLCAWIRLHLGWARVTEISDVEEALELPEVGVAGDVYRIPLGTHEYYLLEYRRRTSTHYDRHLPGEGLLIWHVRENVPPAMPDTDLAERIQQRWSAARVDLVCADGRWADAGYPQGVRAEPVTGADNLGFWAHDGEYAAAHAGNLGDETDPFDGVRFAAFTPDSNPSSAPGGAEAGVRVEDVELLPDRATARVRTLPAQLHVLEVTLIDAGGDQLLTPDEEGVVHTVLVNNGLLAAAQVSVRLTTESDLVEVVQPEALFGRLAVGEHTGTALNEEGFPRLRLAGGFSGAHRVPLTLEISADGALVQRYLFEIDAVYSCRLSGTVVRRDGQPLGGVPVRSGRYSTETASDGTFGLVVPPGHHYVFVEPDEDSGVAGRTMEIALERDRELRIVLLPTVEASGVVRDADGNPVAGALVIAMSLASRHTENTRTAGDGSFTLVLPVGIYGLMVYRRDRPPHLAVQSHTVQDVLIDGTRDLEIDLEAGVTVAVLVTGEDGEPVGPGSVSLSSKRAASVADFNANGEAVVLLPPGRYQVFGVRVPASHVFTDMPLVTIASDTTVHLVLPRAGELSGRVWDESGVPLLFGASLCFAPFGHGTHTSTSVEGDGSYSVSLAQGQHEVGFRHQVGLPASLRGDIPSQSLGDMSMAGSQSLDLTLRPGLPVEGRVTGWQGNLLARPSLHAVAVDGSSQTSTHVRDDGSFTLYVHSGRHRLTLVQGGSRYLSLGTFELSSQAPIEVELPSPARLHGTVVDASGVGVEEALVMLSLDCCSPVYTGWSAFGFQAAALTAQDGTYEVVSGPGDYCLSVLPRWGSGLGRTHGRVHLPASSERARNLSLPVFRELHNLRGDVEGESGVPRSEMVLRFVDDAAGVVAQCRTSPGASYQVELPVGQYRVRAALWGAVAGFRKVHDLGVVRVKDDMRWDIDLSGAPTAVSARTSEQPPAFALEPNCPNPFNASTVIRYRLAAPARVELTIYNLVGQEVRRLVHAARPGGEHRVVWDGRDERGRTLGSGVYLYRLQAGRKHMARKLLLLR